MSGKPMDPKHRRRVWAFLRDDPDYEWDEDWDGRDETELSLRSAMSAVDYESAAKDTAQDLVLQLTRELKDAKAASEHNRVEAESLREQRRELQRKYKDVRADWKTALGERDRWRRIARRHPPTEEDAAHITRTQVKAWEERAMVSTHDEDDESFADRATWLAAKVGRDPWDVLAEMAALTEVKS